MSRSSRGYSRPIAAVALLAPLLLGALVWSSLSPSPERETGALYLPTPCATAPATTLAAPTGPDGRVCVPTPLPAPSESASAAQQEENTRQGTGATGIASDQPEVGSSATASATPSSAPTTAAQPRNDWEAFSAGWAAAVDAWLTPVLAPIVGAVVFLLVCLFVARLLVYLPMNPWGRIGFRRNAVLLSAGVAALLLAATGFVLIVGTLGADGARAPRLEQPGDDPVPAVRLILLPVLLALWGSLALSRVAASRLRVAVVIGPAPDAATGSQAPEAQIASEAQIGSAAEDVPVTGAGSGKEGGQSTTAATAAGPRGARAAPSAPDLSKSQSEVAKRFAAGVRTLCRSDAGSIELPAPGDSVEALVRRAIEDLPVTGVPIAGKLAVPARLVGAAKAAILWFSALTPWVVTVTVVSDDVHLTVRRNGRVILDESMDDSEWELPLARTGEERERDRILLAAASFVIAAARAHPGFGSLAGASDAHALALHSIATTRFRYDRESALRLLTLARERDPGNLAVEVALQRTRFRLAGDRAAIHAYRDWLWEFDEQRRFDFHGSGRAVVDLRCRVLATYLALARNGGESPERYETALKRLHSLVFLRGAFLRWPFRRRASRALREGIRAELAVSAAVTLAEQDPAETADSRRHHAFSMAAGTSVVLAPGATLWECVCLAKAGGAPEPQRRWCTCDPASRPRVSLVSATAVTCESGVLGFIPRGAVGPRLSLPEGTQIRVEPGTRLSTVPAGTIVMTPSGRRVVYSGTLVVASASVVCSGRTPVRPRSAGAHLVARVWDTAVADLLFGTRWRDRWLRRAMAHSDPPIAYSAACMLSRGGSISPRAIELFRTACEQSAIRAWIPHDPELDVPAGRSPAREPVLEWRDVLVVSRHYGWRWRSDPVIDELSRRLGLIEGREPWEGLPPESEQEVALIASSERVRKERARIGKERKSFADLIDRADSARGPIDLASPSPSRRDLALRTRLVRLLLLAGIRSREDVTPRRLSMLEDAIERVVRDVVVKTAPDVDGPQAPLDQRLALDRTNAWLRSLAPDESEEREAAERVPRSTSGFRTSRSRTSRTRARRAREGWRGFRRRSSL